jgi:mutator protein MutT
MNTNTSIKFTGKIAAAIIEKNGKYFIAQRAKADANQGLWEFPGGKQEEGETIQECLKRELNEELGIDATIGEYLCSSFFEHKGRRCELQAFNITSFTGSITCKEHYKIAWISPTELDQYPFVNPDLVFIDFIKRMKPGQQ